MFWKCAALSLVSDCDNHTSLYCGSILCLDGTPVPILATVGLLSKVFTYFSLIPVETSMAVNISYSQISPPVSAHTYRSPPLHFWKTTPLISPSALPLEKKCPFSLSSLPPIWEFLSVFSYFFQRMALSVPHAQDFIPSFLLDEFCHKFVKVSKF